MSKLITVRTFLDPSEFGIAKSFLESEGIHCFGKDTNMNRNYPTNTIQGVELQVLEDQVEQAVIKLIEGGFLKKEDLELRPTFGWIEKLINKFIK